MAAATRIRNEAFLGPVRSVDLDPQHKAGRVISVSYELNVIDGWVKVRERTDKDGLINEATQRARSAVRDVMDAAPECAAFIAESHLLWVKALRQAGRARSASAQHRALNRALYAHGLRVNPAKDPSVAATTEPRGATS